MRAVKSNRNDGSLKDVIGTGNNLNVLVCSDIYLTYLKLVGVGMLFNFFYSPGDDLFHRL